MLGYGAGRYPPRSSQFRFGVLLTRVGLEYPCDPAEQGGRPRPPAADCGGVAGISLSEFVLLSAAFDRAARGHASAVEDLDLQAGFKVGAGDVLDHMADRRIGPRAAILRWPVAEHATDLLIADDGAPAAPLGAHALARPSR